MHELRRRFPRYNLDKPLIAHRLYEQVTVGIRGRWRQFGEGGAGADMSEQLRHGEVLRLDFSPTLKVYAAVRYSRAFFHGFEFVLVKDRQEAEIKQLCRELSTRNTKPNTGETASH